jgi:5-bromo-4-chloroindolyl phosphate hydrolysis protein
MTAPQPLQSAKRMTDDLLHRYSPRGLLLYFLALPLIPAAILALVSGHARSVLINAGCFTLFVLAAVCLRRGLAAETTDLHSRLTRSTQRPLKLYAALLTASTTGLLAFFGAQQTPVMAALFAGGALLGMFFSYGLDRRQAIAPASAAGFSSDEIRNILSDAYAIIQDIELASRGIIQTELKHRIVSICDIAESVIAELEADPRGIRRARKFLHVYLDSVLQVVQGYAKTHRQTESQTLEQNFRQALDAIESAFFEQRQKLLEEDVFDLDVKIEVLTQQLKREGIL